MILILACKRGEIAVITTLVNAGANIRSNNDAALSAAAEYGQADAVKFLLDHGACVNAHNGRALYLAAEHGHIDTMQVIFEYNPAWLDIALSVAQRKCNIEAAQLLLAKGATIIPGTEYGLPWLEYDKPAIISLICTHLNMPVPTKWKNDVTQYQQDCARWQKTCVACRPMDWQPVTRRFLEQKHLPLLKLRCIGKISRQHGQYVCLYRNRAVSKRRPHPTLHGEMGDCQRVTLT